MAEFLGLDSVLTKRMATEHPCSEFFASVAQPSRLKDWDCRASSAALSGPLATSGCLRNLPGENDMSEAKVAIFMRWWDRCGSTRDVVRRA